MAAKTTKPQNISWWNSSKVTNLYGPVTSMFVDHNVAKGCAKTVEVKLVKGEFYGVTRAEFVKELSEVTGAMTVVDADLGNGETNILLGWEDGSIVIKGKDDFYEVEASTNNKRLFKKISNLCDRYIQEGGRARDTIYTLAQDPNGFIRMVPAGEGHLGLKFEPRNYPPEVAAEYTIIRDALRNPDPNGRLTILHGAPGTGKTTLIRGLIKEGDAQFVFLPVNMVDDIGGPAIIQALVWARTNMDSDEPLVLLIEDADRCLVPRKDESENDGDNLSAISALLNASDGLLGVALNIHVICTTNRKYDNIDPALKRPGRLLTEVHIGYLDEEQAHKIFRRITKGQTIAFLPHEREAGVPLSRVYELAKAGEADDGDEFLALLEDEGEED